MTEENIARAFDDFSQAQTDALLKDMDVDFAASSQESARIRNAVFKKAGLKTRKTLKFPMKLMTSAAVAAVVFVSVSFVGFDTVAAAIRSMFTFIPGVGIVEKEEASAYMVESITESMDAGSVKAEIARAVYLNDQLTVVVSVSGLSLYAEDLTLHKNGEPISPSELDSEETYVASNDVLFVRSMTVSPPASDDVFEIAIKGFSQSLSFKLTPCLTYESIEQIGPNDVQNEISITATAQRLEDRLIVWCYPFMVDSAIDDVIVGYGQPTIGKFNDSRYIETESGKYFDYVDPKHNSHWYVLGRTVFEMPENDKNATLHIPYLSMQREVNQELKVRLPNGYTTENSDVAIETDLGKISIAEVKREPCETEKNKDTIRIKLAYENFHELKDINSFMFEIKDDRLSPYMRFNEETGKLEYLEIRIDKKANVESALLNILSIDYSMYGEYVIPLDIE